MLALLWRDSTARVATGRPPALLARCWRYSGATLLHVALPGSHWRYLHNAGATLAPLCCSLHVALLGSHWRDSHDGGATVPRLSSTWRYWAVTNATRTTVAL
eukprot:4711643-Prymnesium_polylepis.2